MSDAGDIKQDNGSPDQKLGLPPTAPCVRCKSKSLSAIPPTIRSSDLLCHECDSQSESLSSTKQANPKRSSSDGAAKAIAKENISDHNMKRYSSEYDIRAASMRAKIEQKLLDIEKEMRLQRARSIENETLDTFEDSHGPFKGMNINEIQRGRSFSLNEMKTTAILRLQAELDKAQQELKLKDEEVNKLSKIRDEVGAEIEDLTASLFEEANNMVREANVKQAFAEKCAKEATMSLNILQEEVQALKSLVESTISLVPPRCITSSQNVQNSQSGNRVGLFRKSPVNLKSPNFSEQQSPVSPAESSMEKTLLREQYEVDPCPHEEFVSWRQNPKFDKNHPFLQRIYLEDIKPCMNFENKELASKVLSAVEENQIIIESVSNKSPLPKMCALLKAPRFCKYKMSFANGEDCHYISVLGRNRITAICDLFCYLRYIEKGLIKHSIHEVYLEVLKKRRRITLARLGFPDTESQ